MKPIYTKIIGALALTIAIPACVPAPRPVPVVTPPPPPASTPAPAVPPSLPSTSSWMDVPQTPGDWTWRRDGSDSIAEYRSPAGTLLAQISCARAQQQVFLSIVGSASGPMTIRTETASRTQMARLSGIFSRALLPPRDPLLDAMALSKGRFAVETSGAATLYLPSWAEVTRVIEDCR